MKGQGKQRVHLGVGAIMAAGALVAALGLHGGAVQAQSNPTPYWASITQVPAIMRRGPGREMPAMWQYVRDDLPVRVIAVYQDWRRVEDPAGVRGWMHSRLLSRARAAIVTGGTRPMHLSPADDAPVAFRAEEGVVGRISDCEDGWCMFDVKGRAGWIRTDHIWGDGPP